ECPASVFAESRMSPSSVCEVPSPLPRREQDLSLGGRGCIHLRSPRACSLRSREGGDFLIIRREQDFSLEGGGAPPPSTRERNLSCAVGGPFSIPLRAGALPGGALLSRGGGRGPTVRERE